MKKRIVTLTTDFGTVDGYVAAMKGVILSLAPGTDVVDLGHDLPPHDVGHAAFFVRSSYPYFPEGAVHVAVVDPGVGSERRGLVQPWRGGFLVGPDNGLFSLLPGFGRGAREIDLGRLGSPVSTTFHGRDVFAKVAARLADGASPESVGPPLRSPVRIELGEPSRAGRGIRVPVAAIDRFGNVILPLRPNDFPFERGQVKVAAGKKRKTLYIVRTYSDLPPKGEGILVGSHGYWELAAAEGSFACRWKLKAGATLQVE